MCTYCVLCPLQDPRETHPSFCRTNYWSNTPAETGGFSTLEVDNRSDHFTDARHRGCWRFLAKKKARAVTAAYDFTCYRGLTCKLLRLLPGRHIFRMIMDLVSIRSVTLTTGLGCYEICSYYQSTFKKFQNTVLKPFSSKWIPGLVFR